MPSSSTRTTPPTSRNTPGWRPWGVRLGKPRRRARLEARAAQPEGLPSVAEYVGREETRRRVAEAVFRLEEPSRAVVLLRYFEGMPPRAIARRLGIPVATVRTRLSRAHAKLRDQLDREYGDRKTWVVALAMPPLARGLAVKAAVVACVAVGVTGITLLIPGGEPQESSDTKFASAGILAESEPVPAVDPPQASPTRERSAVVPKLEGAVAPPAPFPGAREVVLHLFGGRQEKGRLVDYRPPGRYVLAVVDGEKEFPASEVEDVEFVDVGETLRRRGIRGSGLPPGDTKTFDRKRGEYFDLVSGEEGRRRHIAFRDGELSVGFAGADFGHFIHLGPIDGSSVRFEGGRIQAAGRPVRSYELFAHHLDPAPMRLRSRLRPVEGSVYLFRSVTDGTDVVGVLSVLSVDEATISLAWRELLTYGPGEVEERERLEAADWAARSKGRSAGRAVLWARSAYSDYVKATFSFESATRDHVGVVRNDWDLHFGAMPSASVQVNLAGGDRSWIRLVDSSRFESGGPEDFEAEGETTTFTLLQEGTYAVRSRDRESDTMAFFRVKAMDPSEWVEIEWRRVSPP